MGGEWLNLHWTLQNRRKFLIKCHKNGIKIRHDLFTAILQPFHISRLKMFLSDIGMFFLHTPLLGQRIALKKMSRFIAEWNLVLIGPSKLIFNCSPLSRSTDIDNSIPFTCAARSVTHVLIHSNESQPVFRRKSDLILSTYGHLN